MSGGERSNDVCLSTGFDELVDILVVDLNQLVINKVRVGHVHFVARQQVKVFSRIQDDLHLSHIGTLRKLPYNEKLYILKYAILLNYPRKINTVSVHFVSSLTPKRIQHKLCQRPQTRILHNLIWIQLNSFPSSVICDIPRLFLLSVTICRISTCLKKNKSKDNKS